MRVEVLPDAEAAARRAAELIAAEAVAAVAARGRFTLALSGGDTPARMLALLSDTPLPWERTHVFQVDERVAPPGSAERNLTRITSCLGARVNHGSGRLHPMPVDDLDLARAAIRYGRDLEGVAGTPPVLDLVHLGLGTDGHTASLVPGDSVLAVREADVALAGPYQGRRRMTLTLPALNRARRLLWLVTGQDKAAVLARLGTADRALPAGLVRREGALILADAAAASRLQPR
ncbi:MAG TPA: 6-phosphogluconolactonase [Rhodocyclaceae bacterium]|nr:6-phosphogluconolactonase [Rhodocyclaceae bacterium]